MKRTIIAVLVAATLSACNQQPAPVAYVQPQAQPQILVPAQAGQPQIVVVNGNPGYYDATGAFITGALVASMLSNRGYYYDRGNYYDRNHTVINKTTIINNPATQPTTTIPAAKAAPAQPQRGTVAPPVNTPAPSVWKNAPAPTVASAPRAAPAAQPSFSRPAQSTSSFSRPSSSSSRR